MTIEEANALFTEIGDALSAGALCKPEGFSQRLRCASRNELRRAAMLWLADQRHKGFNMLIRIEISPGKFSARREVVDTIWPLLSVLGAIPAKKEEWEPEEEGKKAGQFYDAFNAMLDGLDIRDSAYWEKVYRMLYRF